MNNVNDGDDDNGVDNDDDDDDDDDEDEDDKVVDNDDLIFMSILTWITEKELEIKNKGDQFLCKNNLKILYRRWEN